MNNCWGNVLTREQVEDYMKAEGVPQPSRIGAVTGVASLTAESAFGYAVATEYIVATSTEDVEIEATVESLKRAILKELGDGIQGFSTENFMPVDAGAFAGYVVLVVRVGNVSRERRRAVRARVSRLISGSHSQAVRDRVVLNFR
ncbi:MAG TPA: hypothetical protein VH475_14685 [Tepidisphaeraceae bacterium]|jgi:hypothetical protein